MSSSTSTEPKSETRPIIPSRSTSIICSATSFSSVRILRQAANSRLWPAFAYRQSDDVQSLTTQRTSISGEAPMTLSSQDDRNTYMEEDSSPKRSIDRDWSGCYSFCKSLRKHNLIAIPGSNSFFYADNRIFKTFARPNFIRNETVSSEKWAPARPQGRLVDSGLFPVRGLIYCASYNSLSRSVIRRPLPSGR